MATKRLGGLSQIHVAKLNDDGTYAVPVPVPGAKSVEAELTYEQIKFYSDNSTDLIENVFSGGEGTLSISGLTMSEYQLLFGSTVSEGGALIKSTDIAPELALLFEKKKLGSNERRLFVLYAVKFAPPAISAQTLEGSIEEEVVELSFSIRELADGSIFKMVDSDTAPALVVDEFYTSVQK